MATETRRTGRLLRCSGLPTALVIVGTILFPLFPQASQQPLAATQTTHDAPYAVNLEKGDGRVVVVPPYGSSQFVQFILEARALEQSEYEIVVETESGGGVTCGQDNLHIHYGKKITDTAVIPTSGTIVAWYIAPQRVVAGRARVVVRRRADWQNVAVRSEAFQIPARREP